MQPVHRTQTTTSNARHRIRAAHHSTTVAREAQIVRPPDADMPRSVVMDRYTRYRCMRWNTPLSEAHADRLLDVLQLRTGHHVVDLGCGWGELMLRAAARGATGTGVEEEPAHLARGRTAAARRELDRRVRFVARKAADWRGSADRAMCIGSTHAFGGLEPTLRALAAIVPANGRALLGEGYWATEPTAAAAELFGDAIPGPLGAVRETCITNGWRINHVSTASLDEWDEFEATARAGLATEHAEARKAEYESVYRGVLGFAYLVLTPNVSRRTTFT